MSWRGKNAHEIGKASAAAVDGTARVGPRMVCGRRVTVRYGVRGKIK